MLWLDYNKVNSPYSRIRQLVWRSFSFHVWKSNVLAGANDTLCLMIPVKGIVWPVSLRVKYAVKMIYLKRAENAALWCYLVKVWKRNENKVQAHGQ